MKNDFGKNSKIIALGLIGFHFLAVALHSLAHEILTVKATPAQLAFIFPVIIVAPVAAGFLLLRFEKNGALLLTVSLTASFFLGLYYHFIARTIDHVAHVAELEPAFWAATFEATAYALAFSEICGAFTGFYIFINQSKYIKDYAARTNVQ